MFTRNTPKTVSSIRSFIARCTGLRGAAAAAVTGSLLCAAAEAQPVLEVRIDNQVVAAESEFNFAPTPVDGLNQQVVVLRNVGNQDLVFTDDPPIFTFGGNVDQFTLIQPVLESGNKISPNGSTAFRIDFQPTVLATRLETRVFISTNAAGSPFRLVVAGQSTAPLMVLRQNGQTIANGGAFEFPPTIVGELVEVEFEIRNQGSATLSLTGNPRVDIFGGAAFDFAVTQEPAAQIAAGASTTFTVAFAPVAEGDHVAAMSIPNNQSIAPVNNLYEIDLLALGLPADEEQEIEEEIEEEIDQEIEDEVEQEIDEELDNEFEDEINDEFDNDLNDEFADDDFIDFEEELQDNIARRGLCGFGFPLGLALSLVSLTGAKRGLTRRVRRS